MVTLTLIDLKDIIVMGFDSCLLLSEISFPLFLEGRCGQDSLSNFKVLELTLSAVQQSTQSPLVSLRYRALF